MPAFVFTDAKIKFGGRDLSGVSNQITLTGEVDLQETTTFGANYRTRLAGLFTSSAQLEAYWENISANDSLDSDIFARLAAGTQLFSSAAEGGLVAGIAYMFEADLESYALGDNIGELAKATIAIQGNARLLRGQVLENSTRTATANGTAVQAGAVLATETVHSGIHVTAASGTSPTLDVTVESDDASGFASPLLRITHTQLTGVGSELKSLAGVVTDDWWRLVLTIGGTTPSFTVFGTLAIRVT